MAFTIGVAPATGVNGAGNAACTLVGCTAGRNVIIGTISETATISAPTSAGETCVLRGAAVSASGLTMQMADCTLAGGGDKTFTAALSGTPTSRIWAFEVVESATYDASTNNSGTAANQSVSVTTTVDGCLIVGHLINKGGAATVGASGLYTTMGFGAAVFFECGEYDLDAGAAGAKTVDFTHASGAFLIQGYSWKPVVAGGQPTIKRMGGVRFAAATDYGTW